MCGRLDATTRGMSNVDVAIASTAGGGQRRVSPGEQRHRGVASRADDILAGVCSSMFDTGFVLSATCCVG